SFAFSNKMSLTCRLRHLDEKRIGVVAARRAVRRLGNGRIQHGIASSLIGPRLAARKRHPAATLAASHDLALTGRPVLAAAYAAAGCEAAAGAAIEAPVE